LYNRVLVGEVPIPSFIALDVAEAAYLSFPIGWSSVSFGEWVVDLPLLRVITMLVDVECMETIGT
jgi:hypothetical protein